MIYCNDYIFTLETDHTEKEILVSIEAGLEISAKNDPYRGCPPQCDLIDFTILSRATGRDLTQRLQKSYPKEFNRIRELVYEDAVEHRAQLNASAFD